MPFHFILLGVVSLIVLFLIPVSKFRKILILCCTICFVGSFFTGNIKINNVVLNLLNMIGSVLILASSYRKNCRLNRVLITVFCSGVVYFFINTIKIDYNLYFTWLPMSLLCSGFSLIMCWDIYSSIFASVISSIVCEILSMIFMYENLNFWSLFGDNYLVCIVLCITGILLVKIMCIGVKKLCKIRVLKT